MPTPSLFGRRLAEVRKLRELTQEELAEKARVPAAVISHFETGVRSSASADNLVKLADALRVSVDYLLGRTDDIAVSPGKLDGMAAGLPEDKMQILEEFTDALARSAKRDRGEKK
jgi:transcriptional regulator with XRE-family HTH domain